MRFRAGKPEQLLPGQRCNPMYQLQLRAAICRAVQHWRDAKYALHTLPHLIRETTVSSADRQTDAVARRTRTLCQVEAEQRQEVLVHRQVARQRQVRIVLGRQHHIVLAIQKGKLLGTHVGEPHPGTHFIGARATVLRAPLMLQTALADSHLVHDGIHVSAERLQVVGEMGQGGTLEAALPSVKRARLTDADGRAQCGAGHLGAAASFRELVTHRRGNLDPSLGELGPRSMPGLDSPAAQRFDGRPPQPGLPCRCRIGMQHPQDIQARRRAGRQRQTAWGNHTVTDVQVGALLQPDGARLVHENTVTGSHSHGTSVGRAHLEELLIERVADDGLDRPKADGAIVDAEAKHVAETGCP